MSKRPRAGASRIQHRVTFSERTLVPDGGGGHTQEWVERLTTYAEYKHLGGSEAVMEGRMNGTHTQVMRVRASASTRAINVTWKATDEGGRDYNLRDITPTEDRAWIDILAERGVSM